MVGEKKVSAEGGWVAGGSHVGWTPLHHLEEGLIKF